MNAKRTAAMLLAVTAVLAGCSARSGPDLESPVHLADRGTVNGSELKEVTLTARAVHRLGIITSPVSAVPARPGGARLSIPYAGVVYVDNGSTWTYTQVGGGSYLRVPITVASIVGNTALLSSGPAAGTEVVVVGAPELLGAEIEIGGEE